MTESESIDLRAVPGKLPEPGWIVYCVVHSLVREETPEFTMGRLGFSVRKSDQGQTVLQYQVKDGDLSQGDSSDWIFIWRKMNIILETLSLVNLDNTWLDDQVWKGGEIVWTRPRGVPLVPDKEGDPEAPLPSFPGPETGVLATNLMHHIATVYPRVWTYRRVGCYLLRSSFPGEDFNADILLNFFKIGELVTTAMYGRNPQLKDIQEASRELGLEKLFSRDAIRDFYKVRSRDAAHDWLNAQPVDRADALDCKNWADAMVHYHWKTKGQIAVHLGRKTPDGRMEVWPPISGFGES